MPLWIQNHVNQMLVLVLWECKTYYLLYLQFRCPSPFCFENETFAMYKLVRPLTVLFSLAEPWEGVVTCQLKWTNSWIHDHTLIIQIHFWLPGSSALWFFLPRISWMVFLPGNCGMVGRYMYAGLLLSLWYIKSLIPLTGTIPMYISSIRNWILHVRIYIRSYVGK